MLKVTFVDPVDIRYMGGGEVWLLNVTNLLRQKGYKIKVISFKSDCNVNQKMVKMSKEVDFIYFDSIRFPRGNPLPSFRNIHAFLNELIDADVIYFYEYSPNELLLYLFKYKITTPIIAGFHTSLDPKHNLLHAVYYPIFTKTLKLFSAYHVMNRSLKSVLQHWGFKTLYFIPNGVDTKIFRLRKPPDTDTFNVLYTGRLTEDKGADILLKIIRYVNERTEIKCVKFTICGFGPMRNLIEEIAKKYENVEYLGFVPSEILPQIYANADLFLITSRSEGMPLRLLEAQSCGLPVVGSKVPGVSDVIINGKTGKLISVGDIQAYAKAIKEYYLLWHNSPEQYYEMSKNIKEHIVNNYDWSIIIEKIEKMFKECIQKHHYKHGRKIISELVAQK